MNKVPYNIDLKFKRSSSEPNIPKLAHKKSAPTAQQSKNTSNSSPQVKKPEPEPEIRDKKYIKEHTKNCIIIKKELYDGITPGSKIKYINNDGDFKHGGYVWYSKINPENGKKFFMIGFSPVINFTDPTVKHYAVYWDTIKTLWKQIEVETDLLRKSIDAKQENIMLIGKFLKYKFGDEFTKFIEQN